VRAPARCTKFACCALLARSLARSLAPAPHGSAYHFDESLYTITLCLQKAQRGGQFIFSPPLRTLQTQLAQHAVEHILETGHGVQELAFEPGTISIFCGQRSLHRVAQVHGHLDRLVAVLCYANCKGVRNSQDVQKQFWGRARM
jgi:hypothetical protein